MVTCNRFHWNIIKTKFSLRNTKWRIDGKPYIFRPMYTGTFFCNYDTEHVDNILDGHLWTHVYYSFVDHGIAQKNVQWKNKKLSGKNEHLKFCCIFKNIDLKTNCIFCSSWHSNQIKVMQILDELSTTPRYCHIAQLLDCLYYKILIFVLSK